jgi:hypothetical protein
MKFYLIILAACCFASHAVAGVFELGGAFSYDHNTYNGGSYTSDKSWSTSLGYYFTEESEVEFSYQDSINRDFEPGVQDLSYEDRVYSINFLYHFFEEGSRFKPYLRTGVGQLNRDATGSIEGGFSPPGRLDQVTVIGGLGLKAKISSQIAFKFEFTTFLLGGAVSTWKDNETLNIGGSFYF